MRHGKCGKSPLGKLLGGRFARSCRARSWPRLRVVGHWPLRGLPLTALPCDHLVLFDGFLSRHSWLRQVVQHILQRLRSGVLVQLRVAIQRFLDCCYLGFCRFNRGHRGLGKERMYRLPFGSRCNILSIRKGCIDNRATVQQSIRRVLATPPHPIQ